MKQRLTVQASSRPTRKWAVIATLILILAIPENKSQAQWEIQPTPTTAGLRGIHALANGIAWASGTEGTVLRTTDDGTTWQRCPTPPAAEKLDFRGIQAFDAQTAIVMSSGKGDLSRLYKTTDACHTWTLLFTNPDPDGFWDAIQFSNGKNGYLLGDPVSGSFVLKRTADGGQNWISIDAKDLNAPGKDLGAFAASNSSLTLTVFGPIFGTSGAYLFRGESQCPALAELSDPGRCLPAIQFDRVHLPMKSDSAGSGIFSIASFEGKMVAVGGDYADPNGANLVGAYSRDEGKTWRPVERPPHGYRSAVAYSPTQKLWITVGPNGTDISTDDGRNWRPLRPGPGEAPDADQHWNALSLPFVVGSHGRIGILNPAALKP